MSKGFIVRHLGESKYVVSQEFAIEKIQQELAQIDDRITKLAVQVPDKKVELINAQSLLQSKTDQIDALIPDLNDDVEGALDEITLLQTEAIRLQSAVRKIELSLAELISEDLSLKKRRGQLSAVSESKNIEAWCADYNEELSGDVGLIDVNDEGGKGVIIQPGFEGAAKYSAVRDGALFPDLAQSARQIFFNTAVLAGVQKWMPRYRVGTIISIDGDICSVGLDDAKSSAQSLAINQQSTLSNVPIMYMDCNGLVFSEDDRVVVRFTQNGPLVVGFEKEPKECGLDVYVMDFSQGILRMSPDMRTIKEVVSSGNSSLREFAITNEKLMLVYEIFSTYQNPEIEDLTFLNSRIVFQDSGNEIISVHDTPELSIRQVSGANSNNFLVELNQDGNNVSYCEVYGLGGEYLKRVDMTSPNLDTEIYDFYLLAANDDFVIYNNLDITDGFYAASQTDLDTGTRINYFGSRSSQSVGKWVTKNRIYLAGLGLNYIEIFSASGAPVGTWPYSLRPGADVTCISVTKLKGYIFSYQEFNGPSEPGFSEVHVYDRDGDIFTLSEVVDLEAEHRFGRIPKAMPDMRKLLALDA